MQLYIIAVGHRMSKWVDDAVGEYVKRMPADCRVTVKEIRPVERSGSKTAETVMQLERKRIEDALPKGAKVVVLDERGKDLTTMQLSKRFTEWQSDGSNIAFVIGGADGLDAGFKSSAHAMIRISSMTLPHGMARVLLAEQLYRAWTITQNHPYHRV